MACPSLPCAKSCGFPRSPVPNAPDIIEGVINLRGKIVPVMDLRRILVVEHAGRLAGLIVDSASEVLKIPADAVEAPPAVFQEGGLNCVTGLGKVGGRLVVLLDMSKLLAPGSLQVSSESGEKKADKKTVAKTEARGAAAR
jgi:purine-binding chemotaxis protein CheW